VTGKATLREVNIGKSTITMPLAGGKDRNTLGNNDPGGNKNFQRWDSFKYDVKDVAYSPTLELYFSI